VPSPTVPTSFTAVVRWRGPDPAVEIETHHPGFETPEEAALFANAVSPGSPLGLRVLGDRALELVLADGQHVGPEGAAITVWTLASAVADATDADATDVVVANDEDFAPHPFGGFSFPPSAYGDYEQAQFGVLDDHSRALNVVVDWDEADHLRVTVEQPATPDDTEPTFALGTLPDA
jgi:hypothetical protein